MLLNKKIRAYIIIAISIFGSVSCGDILSNKKHIYKNYYIIQGDTKSEVSLDYKVEENGYVERVPPQVIEYGLIGDSLIIAKRRINKMDSFYIINMLKDNPYADSNLYLNGIFDEYQFKEWCKTKKIQIALNKALN